ncbi:hypothetical protein Clacol_004258 [Clathrus columnatus]|uniref:Uncharacterized protein n=1 Tax=Clathrus columnatus TaxID=1419009 RepID=A0AAV5A921_9AGAM|nr:hypothetical protein Clacol_004258 [Clathrus columnatus]
MHPTARLRASLNEKSIRFAAGNLLRPVVIPERVTGTKHKSAPAFTITRERGFLPREDPIKSLPSAFKAVESLLDRMTIHQPNGTDGLLALGQFGDAVTSELRGLNLEHEVNKVIESNDQLLISALFRDYCFLTSAYLLEPVDIAFRQTGEYFPGRSILPKELARPMAALAEKLNQFPFMEYASSYALQNWARINENGRIHYDNLRLIRAFEDFSGSEKGFILVHVDMVAHSGQLVSAAEDAIAAANNNDRDAFNNALSRLHKTYRLINNSMETMWGRSKPADYLKFRSFIFGTAPKADNPMFPNGVIYEGVGDEKPTHFRGESGANDSMIPLGDNLLEITAKLPDNELTKVLRDFRQYRPMTQREYIASVEVRATEAKVKEFAFADPKSLAFYILNTDQIREFRDRHWRFTKEYIIRRSSYGLATGGSPILKYLPQNLSIVVSVLDEACNALPSSQVLLSKGMDEEIVKSVEECRQRSEIQKRVLDREMEVWQIVDEQKKTESLRTSGTGDSKLGFYKRRSSNSKVMEDTSFAEIDMGEKKRLQRGSVGSDRGG